MSDPISGREPRLGGGSEISGREPFLGGAGSLAALLDALDEAGDTPSDTLVARLANVIPQLAPYLASDDPRVRRTAAQVIGFIAANHPPSREQTVPLLIRVLDDATRHNDTLVIEMAIDRLGETADSRAVDRLLDWPRDPFPYRFHWGRVRAALARLGRLALPRLMECAASGDINLMGVAVTPALVDICRAIPEVRPLVADWLLPIALDTARSSFEELLGVALVVASDLQVERLIGAARDESRGLTSRIILVRRLSKIPDRRVTALMLDLLPGDISPFWHYAIDALTRIRFRADIPRILSLIEHPDPRARRDGLTIAAKRRLRQSLPLVIKALADPDPAVQAQAFETAVAIRDAGCVPPILSLLKDGSETTRIRSTWALVSLVHFFPRQRAEIEAALRAAVATEPDPEARVVIGRYLSILIGGGV